jgi:hypothetical protein
MVTITPYGDEDTAEFSAESYAVIRIILEILRRRLTGRAYVRVLL